ncbi:MAG: ABC-F family ATP-binding cassette domain-containing protein [Clostridiaceae bacterium]|jgi:macrolide transport system ATP-binding/permease protein|nr:ABC-F family ATP-binding cassette domain-containing protein [Clostridiaceae bacterium]
MLLLEGVNIKKFYGDRQILGFDELRIYSGDRIGVTGLNGAGKTTLLDILSGELEPDEGCVKAYCPVGYIRQFDQSGTDEMDPARQEISGTEIRLLKEFDIDSKLGRAALSGGERTRLKIAGAFGSGSVLLFADEPTSNLDYKGIELLRQKLQAVESFVMISHDRSLLDDLCNKIIEVKDGGIRIFNGNFSFYRQRCEMERERTALEYDKYIEEKTALEDAISNRKRRAGKVRRAPRRMGNSEARLHKRQAGESQEKLHNAAKSLVTRLEKLEVKEKPREQPGIRLDFSLTEPPGNKIVISAERLSFSYGSVPVFKDARLSVPNGMKTALWGENGTGKTTLLNLVYAAYLRDHYGTDVGMDNDGGSDIDSDIRQFCNMAGASVRSISIVPKARLAYFRQTFENLDPEETVLKNVMRGSVQNETAARTILARLLLQGDAVFKRVGVLSGGERIKTAFAKLFVSKANVLLLDEPTNYLDMQSIEALGSVLKDYEGTVLFVSHDRAFVSSVADRLLLPGDLTIRSFEGGLEEFKEFEENSKKEGAKKSDELEQTILRMRMTEIISRLSAPNCDKEALEEEYRQLATLLKGK